MNSVDLTRYMDIALRRRYWIIIPLLLTLLAGLAYFLTTPRIYEAETMIMVLPQKVPGDYVREIVSTTVEDRLRTITQQVTSRTNLERVIKDFQLFGDPGLIMEDKINLFRERIRINIAQRGGRGGNAFTISFRCSDPAKAMQVTNALASNFITENLRIREAQAYGTSSFLRDELKTIEDRLLKKEEELKGYRERFMGGLPEQLDTNLKVLERLQLNLDQLSRDLRDAENRKIIIQQQIAEAGKFGSGPVFPAQDKDSPGRDLTSLRAELALLETKYTQEHPDVVRHKELVQRLEKEFTVSSPGGKQPVFNRTQFALRQQLADLELDISRLRSEIDNVKSQSQWYQNMVEETPKREQELLSLNRDYENLQNIYNSVLTRKLEADMAMSMEKKQKGEQFRVIDPARFPERPVEPDMMKIGIVIILLGLGLGGGLAYFVEIMDSSYRKPEEIEEETHLPVLISMPIRYTERELKRKKFRRILAACSLGLGFVLSAIAIFVTTRGLDNALNTLGR